MGYKYSCAVAMVSLLGLLGGCASSAGFGARLASRSTPHAASTSSTVFILNGADGPGPWYNSLVDGFRQGGAADRVRMMNWGAPWFFLPNLLSVSLHNSAEKDLLAHVQAARRESPEGRITLVGHSAGCGVILGMLKRMPEGQRVDTVILLAPAVSPEYDLAPSMAHVSGIMHVFHSDRDEVLLGFSTAVTGTYDHVMTTSAGFKGFENIQALPADAMSRLRQHAYDPAWRRLGHRGGHFGYRSSQFAAQVLAPLAAEKSANGMTTQVQ